MVQSLMVMLCCFRDGDNTNVVLDNLRLVSRKDLAKVNSKKLLTRSNAQINEAVLLISEIDSKVKELM